MAFNRDALVRPDVNLDGQRILETESQLASDKTSKILDNQWLKSTFLIGDGQFDDPVDVENRYYSSASVKFTDTRLGGNIGINSRPQFTPYSDIRNPGRLAGRTDVSIGNTAGFYGMGDYYSEAIDDNAQTIYMRFGVPQHSSLARFFKRAFDIKVTTMARTGRAPSTWYRIGQIAGTIAVVTAFPVLSCTIIAGKVLNTFFTRPTSKFYTMKPTMHMYWSAVNTLVNMIAINKGIIPRVLGNDSDQVMGNPYKLDDNMLQQLHDLMPDVFNDQYGYDIYAMANRAQRIANRLHSEDFERFNKTSDTDFTGYVKTLNKEKLEHPKGEHSFANLINEHMKLGYYYSDEGDSRVESDPKDDESPNYQKNGTQDGFQAYFDAEMRDGAQFAIFKVNHTGTVQESFSNSVVESDLANKFNGMSSQSREARFSLAEGNIADGVVGNTIEAAVKTAGDVATGIADGVTFGGFSALAGLAGSGYIDIPKHWQSSSVSLPESTYRMQLISPYGNPISQMQNIFIPLAMIMAATLPLSTGSQSYTSPFLVQLFDRGRCQIQLGMVRSLSISRGVCNLPFNNLGKVMAVDVTFTVTDLSSIMHMPVSTGSLFNTLSNAEPSLDEDNILMDYLAVLAGQDIYSQIYTIPKARLNLAKKISTLNKFTSPAYWASSFSDSTVSEFIKAIVPGAATVSDSRNE